jgi:sarcosine oxidase subunit gamma
VTATSQHNEPQPVARSPLVTWFRSSWVDEPRQEGSVLQFEDLSRRPRFGCKGAGAEAWLAAAGYCLPRDPNTVTVTDTVLVARLAASEFLVERVGEDGGRVESTRLLLDAASGDCAGPRAAVFSVARQDLVIGIDGAATLALLRQICSVDFAPALATSRANTGPLFMASMAGVSVVAWPRQESRLTLWVDPSFAHYFWTTLLEVAGGLGGLTIINKSNGALGSRT